MADGFTMPASVPTPHQAPPVLLPGLQYGTITKLACKCSPHDNNDFLIKSDRIICAGCGKEVPCMPPILGVFKATCACCSSPSIKTTFILDSRGAYVCTWCGVTR